MWVAPSDPTEELACRRDAEPVAGENQRDFSTLVGEPGKRRASLWRRADADDAIAARVTIAQFSLDVVERVLIFVNGEDDRTAHAGGP